MIAESLLIIVLLSYGACKPQFDDTSNQYQSCDLEASEWDHYGNLPAAVIPLYKDSEYLSCSVTSNSSYRYSLRLNRIQYLNAGTKNNALNFLSTRLIL
jgi:hypothetical protein